MGILWKCRSAGRDLETLGRACKIGNNESTLVAVKQVMHLNMYPEVSGLAAWSGNCKWYSSLPLGAVVSLFCESV
jgi:hypothetical protein